VVLLEREDGEFVEIIMHAQGDFTPIHTALGNESDMWDNNIAANRGGCVDAISHVTRRMLTSRKSRHFKVKVLSCHIWRDCFLNKLRCKDAILGCDI